MNIIRYIGIAILMLSLFGCNNEPAKTLEEENTLIMGVTADYPPFEFIKHKKIVGFDIDLAHEIANELGYKIYIKDMDFSALIPALHAGKIDFILSSMSRTPEREKAVDFSVPYYIPTFAIIYKKDNPIKRTEDFSNKTIAVQLGSTMELFLKEQLKRVKNLDILTLSRTPTMIQELKLGRVNGVLIEEAQAKEFSQKNPELAYSLIADNKEGIAVAFAKNSKLKSKFNAAINKLKKSGKLEELENKWLL